MDAMKKLDEKGIRWVICKRVGGRTEESVSLPILILLILARRLLGLHGVVT